MIRASNAIQQCYILRTRIDVTSYGDACDQIASWARNKQSKFVVAANAHVVTTAWLDADYCNAVNDASLVTPDGVSLVKGMHLLGHKGQSRVYGPELMLHVCARAAKDDISIYLYGGTEMTLGKLSQVLRTQFPTLRIAGTYSPPFRTLTRMEEAIDTARINDSGAGVVFIGLGCPKQEKWMERQANKLNAVAIGVGAAFRFHSGEVSQAPGWMMKYSLEWLYRLYQEPNRLWQRYLVGNSLFLILFGSQLAARFLAVSKKSSS